MLTPHAMFTLLAGLILMRDAEAKSVKLVGLEDILEQAHTWILDYDDDDDGSLNAEEMGPLLKQLFDTSHAVQEAAAQGRPYKTDALTVDKLLSMCDHNGDGKASSSELVDFLKRMKGYDGGHIEVTKANTPGTDEASWEDPHLQRVLKKRKRKAKRRATTGKDET